jgi:BirA family biotin operon repressor/biotin-[acetyl-CoA-carboxylase] ligase
MPIIRLTESTIAQQLNTLNFTQPVNIHLMESIDSTNRFLKDLPQSNAIDLSCAETQTQGRGRLGRAWHSPFGENIYCSTRWPLQCNVSQLAGLSLVVSMAVIAALNDVGIKSDIQIKWPNDLLWNDQKLCGNLIEVVNNCVLVIGIGLNVNSITKDYPLPDKPWCSLYDMTGNYWDRNVLIAHVLVQLHQHIQQLMTHGLPSFFSTWQSLDYLYGRHVMVSHQAKPLSGQAHGIDEKGQLIVIDESGVTHVLSSGDTTLRTQPFLPSQCGKIK